MPRLQHPAPIQGPNEEGQFRAPPGTPPPILGLGPGQLNSHEGKPVTEQLFQKLLKTLFLTSHAAAEVPVCSQTPRAHGGVGSQPSVPDRCSLVCWVTLRTHGGPGQARQPQVVPMARPQGRDPQAGEGWPVCGAGTSRECVGHFCVHTSMSQSNQHCFQHICCPTAKFSTHFPSRLHLSGMQLREGDAIPDNCIPPRLARMGTQPEEGENFIRRKQSRVLALRWKPRSPPPPPDRKSVV